MKRFILIILYALLSQTMFAQLTDLARLEYSFIPKSNSEDQYTRLRLLVNYPLELGKDRYLVVGAEYNRIILNLEDEYPFENALLETINIIELSVGYTFKISKNWRLGFQLNPRIASTLTEKITSDDFFINGGAFAINDHTKDENVKRPYRLILGLTYNSTTGIPFPLPFISYYRRISDNWSFTAGVPKSNLRYYLNKNNMLQGFVGLDGYFAHLQKPQAVLGKQIDNISLSVVVGGLGYEYLIGKNLVAYLYSGYTFRLNNTLRDKNRNEVFKLDDVNAFYLRTGIKIKI